MNLSQEEIKQEIDSLSEDYEETKETWKEQRYKGKRKTIWLLKKYKNWVLLAIAGLILIFTYFGVPQIPKWVSVVGIAFIMGIVISYFPAKKLASMFVKDDRIPFFVIKPPNEENAVEVHKIPREMISDMLFYGNPMPVDTKKGRGFVVDELSKKVIDGELKIAVIGTKLGSMGIEYRRNVFKEIKKNRNLLAPKANKYEELMAELPFLLDKVKQENTQNIIEGWENLENFGENHGQQIINEVEQETQVKDANDVLEQMKEQNKKQEQNESEKLKQETIENFELELNMGDKNGN